MRTFAKKNIKNCILPQPGNSMITRAHHHMRSLLSVFRCVLYLSPDFSVFVPKEMCICFQVREYSERHIKSLQSAHRWHNIYDCSGFNGTVHCRASYLNPTYQPVRMNILCKDHPGICSQTKLYFCHFHFPSNVQYKWECGRVD